jgi:uncharacterized Zn finger protein
MTGQQWRLYCPNCESGNRKQHTEIDPRDRRDLESDTDERLAECNTCGNIRPTADGLVSIEDRADRKNTITEYSGDHDE